MRKSLRWRRHQQPVQIQSPCYPIGQSTDRSRQKGHTRITMNRVAYQAGQENPETMEALTQHQPAADI